MAKNHMLSHKLLNYIVTQIASLFFRDHGHEISVIRKCEWR
jgi:hypothetical protein